VNATGTAQAPQGRVIGDIPALRKSIYDNVLREVKNLPELSSGQYRLRLADVDYADPEEFPKQREKQAILAGQTLSRRLRGTWQLVDGTGRVVSTKRATLASVPYLTPRGTYIVGGTDYTLLHQQRLRPGIFTRVKATGELESHVNVAKGYGHRYFLDPKTGIFRLRWGQAQLPLYPVLRALGAKDRDIEKAWGRELFSANIKQNDRGAIDKLYMKLWGAKPGASEDEKIAAIREAFAKMELDPEVTHKTLGKAYSKVDPEVILAATQRLLHVQQGKQKPDNRDALAYQRLVGPEDVIAEQVRRAMPELRRALYTVVKHGDVKRMPTAVLDKALRNAFIGTGLGQILDGTNPLEAYDKLYHVTRMGAGALPSIDAIPDQARALQPSQAGFWDPVTTPESLRISVDGRLTLNTRKTPDNRMLSRFVDVRTGKLVWKSPQELSESVVALPGTMRQRGNYVRAIVNDKIRYVPKSMVDYELAHATDMFGPTSNAIPGKYGTYPQRVSMGSRMSAQALSLVNREAPLVRSSTDDGKSFEELYGPQMGAMHSPATGTVTKVADDHIIITDRSGKKHRVELYHYMPGNRKSFLHNTPVVKPGDTVTKGKLIATSNFTDDKGHAALGLNARVAYIADRGWNHEDAISVSRSFADRAKSERVYQHNLDLRDDAVKASKAAFVAVFPSELKKDVLANYDDSGVIKPGTKVMPDQPLVLAVKERQAGPRVGKARRSFANASITWKHHSPGVVTDVYKGPKGVNVIVRSTAPLEVGDKLSGLYGDKGVIARIIPDDQMPVDEKGRPFEVLLNPAGIVSRGNPAQVLLTVLGKIARQRGKPYILPEFDQPGDFRNWVEAEASKAGIKPTETITDPVTGRKIKNVLTGERYLLNLHHMAEVKLQGRATGGYTAEGLPASGGEEGSKRLGMMELYALLSHGAYGVISDAKHIRGQSNEDFWRQVISGNMNASPNVPSIYKKFVSSLQAAGINPVRTGNRVNIMALTAKDVDRLAGGRELKNAETVDWSDQQLKPVRGGLFDPKLTGGHDGTFFSYIKLHQRVPNPVMEEPLRRIFNLTEHQFRDVLAGRTPIGQYKGADALYQAAKHINLDSEIAKTRAMLKDSRKTYRDNAIRRLKYLEAAKRLNQHPADWFWDKLPVLPPRFRAVAKIRESGTTLVDDANVLYRDVFDANDVVKSLDGKVGDLSKERLMLYDAVKAVTGLGDPVPTRHKQQRVRGILKSVLGSSPKHSMIHRKLLGSPVDLVGRATITPDPNLTMDEVGLPEEKAWVLYKFFIANKLVRSGVPRLKALQEIKERTPKARKALLEAMDERPVLINRAPTLHKYSIIAVRPKLTRHKTLRVSPLILSPIGGDFDGDSMQFHVPVSQEAVRDAYEKMLPSKNLLSAGAFKPHWVAGIEYVSGLWEATKAPSNKPVRVFRNKQDARAAFRRGDIDVNQPIEILEG